MYMYAYTYTLYEPMSLDIKSACFGHSPELEYSFQHIPLLELHIYMYVGILKQQQRCVNVHVQCIYMYIHVRIYNVCTCTIHLHKHSARHVHDVLLCTSTNFEETEIK